MRMTSIVAALILSLPVLGANAQVCSAETLKTVKVGSVGATAVNWPVYIAEDKGLFKAEGLNVQVIYVGNVANTVQQLIAGAFGIANSTFDSGIRGIAKGGDGVMIGGMTTKYPYSIMTAADVHKLADLKGKSIILPFPKDLLTIVWNRWVSEHGMDPKAIDQIYDGATRNRFNALAAGAAQAALLTQPYDFRAAAMGGHKLVDLGAYAKEYGFIAIMSRPQWLKENPDAARAYLRAIAKATDRFYDTSHRDEAVAILAHHTKLSKEFAAQTYDYYAKDLHPFSRGAALPRQIVEHTFMTLVDIGDISKAEAKKSQGHMMDLNYLPK